MIASELAFYLNHYPINPVLSKTTWVGSHYACKPFSKLLLFHLSGGQTHNYSFLLIHVRLDLIAVQPKKRFHRKMTDTFVSVQKGMVHPQGKAERRRLFNHCRLEILFGKGRGGLRQCRL